MIGFEPSEEQELIVETVRQFAANEVRPAARDCDESGKVPDALIAQAHELGLVANGLPEAHGGGGERSAITGALIAEELAWGDLSIALAILSPSLAALPVADFGSDALQAEVLPRYADASFRSASLALVEPQFGADPYRPTATAKPDGDAFRIDGKKCLVPWLDGASDLIVTASLDGKPAAFLVSRDAEGLNFTRERNLGIQAFPTAELDLKNVPTQARLGDGDSDPVREIVNRGRVALSAAAVGVARAAFEVARDYAKEREAFGAPIATKQAIAFKLADMAIEIDGARLLNWEAAWKLDQGEDATREATLAYQQARKVSLVVTDGAVQVLGGHGYTREYLPEMHLRNARGFACFEALSLV